MTGKRRLSATVDADLLDAAQEAVAAGRAENVSTWVNEALRRHAGMLLRDAKARDVIDAALVLLARDGDSVLTSDAGDLVPLVRAADLHVDVVPV